MAAAQLATGDHGPGSAFLDLAKGKLRGVAVMATTQSVPVAVKFALYPMERFRLVLQTKHMATGGNAVSDIFTKPRSLGDVTQLWRGFGTTSVRWFVYQQVNFAFKDFYSGVLPQCNSRDGYFTYAVSKIGAGAAAGLSAAFFWGYPLDVVRQALATSTHANSGNWLTTVEGIYKTHGIRGFYRGYCMDAPGLMIFRGVQLGGWDMIKDHYGPEEWEKKSWLGRFWRGQIISLVGSSLSYPWDTWRRNLIRSHESRYMDVLRAGVDAAGGYRRFFYCGFSVRMLSSVVNGALLEAYDEWKRQTRNA
eukprot:TRINITY_DN65_c9_g1_i1.p1 TRINITY_DN65_c9_g1~~TRINITY_DN65_c9_g1_i1.p1  ORF type:complete len:306 (+),score=71.67 TRINITY_DN65_c9_g1_i1:115-1032(+)